MACSGDTIQASYEGNNDDYENGGTGQNGRGQSFKVASNADICAFSLFGSAGNLASGTFKVEILSGSFASGDILATTGTLTTTSALSSYGSAAWNKIEFEDVVLLTAGVQYYLRMTAISGSSNDEVRWSTDTSSSYADGAYYSSNIENTGRDRNFRIHGVESAAGPATLKTWNGVAVASIKTINGAAIASVKTINTAV